MFRIAARNVARPAMALKIAKPASLSGLRFNSGPGAHEHETESYEDFNKRYEQFFSTCNDRFELQRGLNNSFSYDLVPSVAVVAEALRAARRCDDFTTAVRVLQSLTFKTENEGQLNAYLEELDPVIKELGVPTSEAAIRGQ